MSPDVSMDLIPNEDQRALRDSIERLLADHYGTAQRTAYARQPEGWSRALWARLAELGLLGLTVPPDHGGSGLGAAEVMVAAEALGHALVLEPWMSTAIIGTAALQLAGSEAQRAQWLPRIAEGAVTIAWAPGSPAMPGALPNVETTAPAGAQGWLLEGAQALVMHGDSADRLLVSAKLADGSLALFLVAASSPGLSREAITLQDGRRAAHLRMEKVPVLAQDRLGMADAAPVIEHLCDIAVACVCAEAVGVLQEMLDLTVAYIKTRQQFGVPIGSFQALQHRAVDMLVQVDAARSMALYAAGMVMEPDALERRRAMAAAKVQIGRSARFVGQQAVQLHGGMGMSMETKVARCFLRSTAIEHQFGGTEAHLQLLARLGGLISPQE